MCNWLILNKEVIEVITGIVMAFAVIVATIALFISARAIFLQRKSMQANLFNDISSRIRQLEDQWVECKNDEDRKRWYGRIFSTFEYFAFFANRNEISKEMKHYYRSGIETYIERLKSKHEDLFNVYKERAKKDISKRQFCELRKYYEHEIGKKLPF